ncbi:MAG: DNA double-strand break repair nuclease NurA, partial [Candidatus Hodarchaeales archaeon]
LRAMSLDDQLYKEIKPQNISGLTIGGVDGGYVAKHLIGYDLHLFRAIAVYSTFTKKRLIKTTYFPSKNPKLEIELNNWSFSTREAEKYGNLRRSITELSIATQVIDSTHKTIDILLMDGSPFLKNPSIQNELIPDIYQLYLDKLSNLLSSADRNNTQLIWIVKDSRVNIFTAFLGKSLQFFAPLIPELLNLDYRNIVNRVYDMDLFYYLLKLNTRSFSLINQHQISEEINYNYQNFQFYLKTAKYDIPLRVEGFLPRRLTRDRMTNALDLISETLLPISQYYHEYGIPAPIVEADARVKIKESEIFDYIKLLRSLNNYPEFNLRRRERSPWKF